jgi:O-antigen ligase
MRVATYTQATAATRSSIFALMVLVGTVLLGTGVIPTIFVHFGGALPTLLTPLWLLLYLAALGGLMFTQGINWITWLVRYRILLVLLIAGTVMSVSWSIDTQLSTERAVHLVGSTLLAIYVGFSIPLLSTLRIFAAILAIVMLASVGAAITLPGLGIEDYEGRQVWSGVFNSKNDLGFWAAVAVLLYITISDSIQSGYLKVLCYLMAGICLLLLALSQSATSLLALLVAGAMSLYLFIAIRFQLGFVRMVVLAVLFVSLVAFAIVNIETAELVGRSEDLTGRGEVWAQTWKLILDKPITGYGYGALWFPDDSSMWIQESLTDFTWVVHHAHNGLLHIASEIGMPLALIAILMVLQQLIEIFYCQYERQQVGVLFVLAFVIAYLISNYSEARFLVTRELYWIFFLALPISMLRQINLFDSQATAANDRAEAGSYAEASPAPWQPVPGKPWLGPLPRERAQAAAAASTSTAMMPYANGADAGGSGDDDTYQDDTAAGSVVDEFDLMDSSLSVTVTEIDLGELVDGEVIEPEPFDDSLDVTAEVIDDQLVVLRESEDDADQQESGGRIFDHDDTFGDDRYDIKLDTTGEWVEVPLDSDFGNKR